MLLSVSWSVLFISLVCSLTPHQTRYVCYATLEYGCFELADYADAVVDKGKETVFLRQSSAE